MPDPTRRLIYWDANVILSYLDGDDDRFALLDGLLEDSEQKVIEIVTSLISTTEVAYAAHERLHAALDSSVEAAISNLWLPRSPVRVTEVHRNITDAARNLIRASVTKGWTGLRAHDAIHLATAQREGVAEFHTYEEHMDRYSALTGFRICRPYTDNPRMFARGRPFSKPPS